MPKFGAHAFVWIGSWDTDAGNYAINAAAKAGCDFIEICMMRPQDFDAKSHKKALADAGIEATVSLGLPADAHMPFEPKKAKEFLTGALDKMEATGLTYLCGCVGYSLGVLTGAAPTAGERQIVVETLAEVAQEANKRGITLALEVCNRYETYMYNSLADGDAAVKQIRALSGLNFELHADTYHMNIEEEGFHKPLVQAADTLGYIHMSESHRGLVGSGTVNWDQVFQGLVDAHYKGPLVLESFAAVNPDLAAATCLWRPTNKPPEVLASEGLRFLREKAEKAGLS